MKFDPDKPSIKHRSMSGVWHEQDGHRFTAGFEHVGPINEDKPAKETDTDKKDVRERARAKIAKKKSKKKASKKKAGQGDKGDLDGFREKETPDAVSSAVREDEAARRAEDNA